MDCTDANMMKANADMDKDGRRREEDHGNEGNDHGERNDGQEGHGGLQDPYEQAMEMEMAK